MKNAKVGFIGLGIMGSAMARNLLSKGFHVSVFSRTRSKADDLLDSGAAWADSPAELADCSDFVCIAVDDGAAVKAVLTGPKGVVEGLRKQGVVIDFSTIAPREAREIGAELEQRGLRFLDAPVSGGDVGARNGTLTIMVGGAEGAFQQAESVLAAVGKHAIHFGPNGAGQLMKAVNQIAVSLSVLAMTEAFTFAKGAALPMDMVLSTLQTGAAGSWSFTNYAPRVLAGDFAPGFSAKHMLKDLGIVLEEAKAMNISLPGVEMIHQLYEDLIAKGFGGLGNHGLIQRY